jgi:uncharacterized membrane protein YhaH (DUF805 family)
MDVKTAYAVLRLKPESSLAEANEVFDAQAIRFDPDRVKRSLRPAAESKMAQVNEAWDAVRGHLQSGGGPVSYEPVPLPEPSQRIRPVARAPRPVDKSLSAEAGWHVQPDGGRRYWDGDQWTERTVRPALRRMSFPEAVKSGLTQYADFSGRARRSEFWWFALFTSMVSVGAALLDWAFNSSAIVQILMLLVLVVPSLAVTVRRLHDTNRSGWTCLIDFIPFVGGILLLVFECEDSVEDPNRYGPSPKYA